MIRVLLRHIMESDGRLIGDFPPSEIATLMDLLTDEPIYDVETGGYVKLVPADDIDGDSSFQWRMEGDIRKRFVLEALVDAAED